MPGEFELIDRVFRRAGRPLRQTALGIGDDAALIRPAPGMELAISTDLLVSGTHFLADTDPADLGWKTLAVNLSDLAAMGAEPRWATLGIAVPPGLTFDWIEAFAAGFFECADRFGVDLVGGDTTRGPCTLAVTIVGDVPAGQALRRDGARVGDTVWVSGTPGRAALGLACLQGKCSLPEAQRADCIAALQRPQPRVALGLALRGIAHAAIDVSDGMLGDLGHILNASGVGAELQLPADGPVLPGPVFDRDAFLAGGDDYELLFTAPASADTHIRALGDRLDLPLTPLGRLVAAPAGQLTVRDAAGVDITPARRGYDHFA